MYQKILIPLDSSKVGESALAYVENLLSKIVTGGKGGGYPPSSNTTSTSA